MIEMKIGYEADYSLLVSLLASPLAKRDEKTSDE